MDGVRSENNMERRQVLEQAFQAQPMSDEQIITADFEKNHQGREYTLDQAMQSYQDWQAQGGEVYKSNDVLVLFKPIDGKGVEFHCINGGDAGSLVTAVNEFLTSLQGQYPVAVTYYDNPAINDLLDQAAFPVEFKQVNQGQERTFAAVFMLQGSK